MKMKLNEHGTGIVIGAFAGIWHLLWSLFVAFDYAKTLLDWIFGLHFLNNPYQIQPFILTNAIMLIVVTSVIGYAAGWVFATIWNILGTAKK